MSVEMMSLVFRRYPVGGGEYVLALALADHAHDDGTRIFPGIALLAHKSRQSERTVQRQIASMVDAGWLILVAKGGRGPCDPNEYRINPDWIAGAEFDALANKGDNLSPLNSVKKGDTAMSPLNDKPQASKGDKNASKGDKNEHKGDTVMSPEPSYNHQYNHQEPVIEETREAEGDLLAELEAIAGRPVVAKLLFLGVPASRVRDWFAIQTEKGFVLTAETLDQVEVQAETAGISLADAVGVCIEQRWAMFKSKWFAQLGAASGSAVGSSGAAKSELAGRDWRSSEAGVLQRGRELGIDPSPGESGAAYAERVRVANNKARAAEVAQAHRARNRVASGAACGVG